MRWDKTTRDETRWDKTRLEKGQETKWNRKGKETKRRKGKKKTPTPYRLSHFVAPLYVAPSTAPGNANPRASRKFPGANLVRSRRRQFSRYQYDFWNFYFLQSFSKKCKFQNPERREVSGRQFGAVPDAAIFQIPIRFLKFLFFVIFFKKM